MSTLWTQLSWSQYKLLLAIDNEHKSEFLHCWNSKNNWTVWQLECQINSSLFEHLLASGDKESVLAVAKNEKLSSDACVFIKDQMYLEFLGLKGETAIMKKIWNKQL